MLFLAAFEVGLTVSLDWIYYKTLQKKLFKMVHLEFLLDECTVGNRTWSELKIDIHLKCCTYF